MELSRILPVIINGVVRGGLYASMSAGLALITGVMGLSNFAHGEFYMVGAYASYWVFAILGIHPLLAIVAGAIAGFVVGALVERGIFRPLHKRYADIWLMQSFVITVGLSYVFQNGALLIFGPRYRGIQSFWAGSVMSVSIDRWVTFVITILILIGLRLLLNRTMIGRSMRAIAQDEAGAMLVGIDLDRIRNLTFALGTAMAAVAGASLLSMIPAFPGAGVRPGVKSWFVMMLTGLGNLGGAILGGFFVGMVESVFYQVLEQGWVDVASLCILILVLVFRPTGLFGTGTRE